MLEQISIYDLFFENLQLSLLLIIAVVIIIEVIFVKLFVKIVRQGVHFKHFRRGRLIKESRDGGICSLIPIIDRLETEGGILRPVNTRYIGGFTLVVPPGERYLLVRRGIPIRQFHEGERITKIPFFDWVEVIDT